MLEQARLRLAYEDVLVIEGMFSSESRFIALETLASSVNAAIYWVLMETSPDTCRERVLARNPPIPRDKFEWLLSRFVTASHADCVLSGEGQTLAATVLELRAFLELRHE